MGKKLNPSSVKISKQDEKKHLNSLIKVLRPKVYITDSSSFKKLVQDLTGYDGLITSPNLIPSPPPSLPLPMPCHHVDSPPVNIIQEDNLGIFQDNSLEVSLDSPQQSFPLTTGSNYTDSNLLGKLESEFSEYRDVESWLLEIDQYDMYAPILAHHHEVCVYDYDLSGIM